MQEDQDRYYIKKESIYLMKKKLQEKIPIELYFVVAIALIVISFPRTDKFKYSFTEGKPWRYGLLTAPFDIPVHKTDTEMKTQKDSVTTHFRAYYFLRDSLVEQNALDRFAFLKAGTDTSVSNDKLLHYLQKQLHYIYTKGILSGADYAKVDKTNSRALWLRGENNISSYYDLDDLFTPKTAYEYILSNKPSNVSVESIQALNIDQYINSNLKYNKALSDRVLEEKLSKIPSLVGVVQAGEKIIDRGEIVNTSTYRVLSSLQKQTSEHIGTKHHQSLLKIGEAILVSLFVFCLYIYLRLFRPRELTHKNVIFILLNIVILCVVTAFLSTGKGFFNAYILPFAIPTIMVRIFIDSRTAMVVHTIIASICAMVVPIPLDFIILQLIAGYVAIFSLKDLTERSQLMRSSFFILTAYIIAYIGVSFAQDGDFAKLNWRMFVYFGINFVFLTFTYFLVYLMEKTFGFISGVSMVELSNINKPLLMELSEKAPGTFQHSLQVSNLAASAAMKIGADAILVRTGALYHDIGKLERPEYFTENQSTFNPHSKLSLKESAKIIISHVNDGIRLAKKYNLPQQIIDFIATHHGTGKAKYFYNTYKNQHPDEEVNEADFQYPGPNPFSKETAILMMADTVEAASRSLTEYTEESIRNLVNNLIDAQLQEGLFSKAPITFRDIEVIKEVFCEKLMTVYHTRISYPELEKNKDN